MAEKLLSRLLKNRNNEKQPIPNSPLARPEITIDFPREEELISCGHYAVRLSGLPEAQVEISVNDGEWQGCRTAVGYYWFDWSPAKAGEYLLNARLRVGKGRWRKSDQRYCRVLSAKKAP